MIDYKKLYLNLFNAITDAERMIGAGKPSEARRILQDAQIKAEEMHMADEG